MKSARILDSPLTFVLVFDAGDEALQLLTEFVSSERIASASLTAIGAFERCVLGYFDWKERRYQKTPLHDQVEVLSLIGNVTEDSEGKPKIHAHVVLGTRDMTTRGGHLIEGHVRPTLEVTLVESPQHLRRTMNDQVGLPLIDLRHQS